MQGTHVGGEPRTEGDPETQVVEYQLPAAHRAAVQDVQALFEPSATGEPAAQSVVVYSKKEQLLHVAQTESAPPPVACVPNEHRAVVYVTFAAHTVHVVHWLLAPTATEEPTVHLVL